MQAICEITDWAKSSIPNHIYLLDGSNLVAYIQNGTNKPFYFKQPIKGFDKRGRKFVEVKPNPFKIKPQSNLIEVKGSRGDTYHVDPDARTCTCSDFTFRGNCKHIKVIA